MEVNARPELKDDVIDKVVNRPMVCVLKPITAQPYHAFYGGKSNLCNVHRY